MAKRRFDAYTMLLEFRTENKDGLRGLQDINKSLAQSGEYANQFKGQLAQLRQRGDDVRLGIQSLRDEIDTLDTGFGRAATGTVEWTGELQKLRYEMLLAADAKEELANAPDLISKSAGSISDSSARGALSAGGKLINQIAPGTNQAVELVGQVTGALGGLGPVAAIAAPAVILVNSVLGQLAKQAEDARLAVVRGLDAQAEYFALLETGNEEAIKAKIDQLNQDARASQAQVGELEGVSAAIEEARKGFVGFSDSFGKPLKGPNIEELLAPYRLQLEEAGVLAKGQAITATTTEQLASRLDELRGNIESSTFWAGKYQTALDDGTVAARSNAEAIQAATEQGIQNNLRDIETRAAIQEEITRLVQSGSTEELEARKASLKIQKESLTTQLNDVAALLAATKQGSVEQQKYSAQLAILNGQFITTSDTLNALSAEFVASAVDANDAAKEAEEIRKQSAATTQKYYDDIAKADENNLKTRADILDRYNDALIKAAETVADAGEKALEKLEEQQDKLFTNFQRNQDSIEAKQAFEDAKRAVEQQREEVKIARDNANALRKIREESLAKEEELISRRDFRSLYFLRRDTNAKLKETIRQQEEERQARELANADKNTDEAAQREFERQQRQQKYQQDLADAQAAYNKDIQNAQVAYNKAIALAVKNRDDEYRTQYDKYFATLNLLKDGVIKELALTAKGNAGKLALEAEYYEKSQALLKDAINRGLIGDESKLGKVGKHESAGLGRLTTRAMGGGLRRGQIALVNEPGSSRREGFNNVPFPRSLGLFVPMQSGTVNRDTGRPSITNTFNIRGNDAKDIAKVVTKEIGKQLDYYFG